MAYTKHPTWIDKGSPGARPVMAADLNDIEEGIYQASLGGGAVSDATTSAKGVVQLAGDLAGTAAAPTVPGLAGKAATSHTHAAADITSGTVATARLGSGTASSTTYLRGDGTWATPGRTSINAQTGTTYTLVAGDEGKTVTLSNAAAITLNAPGSVFVAGARVDCIVIGAGMVTVVGTSGATVNGTPSLVSRAQWSAFSILWLSATQAVVVGDLA